MTKIRRAQLIEEIGAHAVALATCSGHRLSDTFAVGAAAIELSPAEILAELHNLVAEARGSGLFEERSHA